MKNKKPSIILRLSILLIGVLIIIYIVTSMYFKEHFYFGTTINGIDCSMKTIDEVKELINSEAATYQLDLKGRDGLVEYISAEDINLTTVFDKKLEESLLEQSPYTWILGFLKESKYEIETMLSFDEKLLTQVYNKFKFFEKENIRKPEDAYIEFDYSKYVIRPSKAGCEVEKDVLYEYIVEAINILKPTVILEDTNCYTEPNLTEDSAILLNAVMELNKHVEITITYEFGDSTEVVDAAVIHNWIEISDDYSIELNKEKVKEYVDYLGYTYNTFGMKRKFNTSYNKEVIVTGGDYGWWLNRTAEVEELMEVVRGGESIKKDPNYYQKAVKYGEDDIGDTYVEINLITQHLFYYKDGELVVDSDFVSGNPSRGNATPVGTYSITYKERDGTLVGENYSSPVNYWMPFNHNIGMHDASWRNKFGGEIYLKNGSHGCINLPFESAETIFQSISKGTPVICYELEVKKDEMETITE